MEYNFNEIEKKWQDWWTANEIYKVSNDLSKPKYYVLDMFPYPSGKGLHVGHPLGYIASDIYARYKRLKGFNVLHPMGYDAFGLPAEQYAIEHGVHPVVSTEQNIQNFRKQMDKIAFSFDWSREVNTSEPSYYKWTQWIFLQLFKSFYNRQTKKAESIESLIAEFEKDGNKYHPIPNAQFQLAVNGEQLAVNGNQFNADQWKLFTEKQQQDILMEYRLAYCGYGEVNWCEALGTVLANDEVINGVSERGGYPVVKKKLRQWYLRITEYADRLLEGLETVDFSEAMKEMQTNWIGKSYGADIDFRIAGRDDKLRVFTTRPDTIFGVDFMVIAPEHELVEVITTKKHKHEVDAYISWVKSRSERERMAEKTISGVFTGAYAVNPFDMREIPVYISEYVLAGYGTGAIMAVPCGDERDFKFAKHFNIEITNILGDAYNGEEANPTKDAELVNSNFLTGMLMKDAIKVIVRDIEDLGIGKAKVNYKMRDAAFSRQRYWGEPFPIIWKDGIAYPLDENELPLELPKVEHYKAGPEGEGPLANVPEWTAKNLETNTMPGYAGSSWYFLRYMDPHNNETFCDKKASDYWNQVDVYVGGTEHAVGHLLYSRMWTKFLFDLSLISFDEPYKKLLNQGMIQGSSRFVYRINFTIESRLKNPTAPLILLSKGIFDKYNNDEENVRDNIDKSIQKIFKEYYGEAIQTVKILSYKPVPLHVSVNLVDGFTLDIEAFKKWRSDYSNSIFIFEEEDFSDSILKKHGTYICGSEIEKMSKSKLNSIDPSDLVNKYGADTFRMYEMFLGPVEQSKPWDTKGIEGVHRFLRKFWRLFYKEGSTAPFPLERAGGEAATDAELKVLHKAIKKIQEDTERFSYNTAVSAFMVCTNELSDLKCSKKEVLEPLVIMLSSYAPFVAEELYHALGNEGSVLDAAYPTLNEKYLVESSKQYPISINGKLRTTLNISLDASESEVKEIVLQNDVVQKWLEGKEPKKIIFIKNRMVNIVI
jgi:leucyl-tRNA synthetase